MGAPPVVVFGVRVRVKTPFEPNRCHEQGWVVVVSYRRRRRRRPVADGDEPAGQFWSAPAGVVFRGAGACAWVARVPERSAVMGLECGSSRAAGQGLQRRASRGELHVSTDCQVCGPLLLLFCVHATKGRESIPSLGWGELSLWAKEAGKSQPELRDQQKYSARGLRCR